MKNKYYLNGKLVRTSARDYMYAITYRGIVVACCGNEEIAQKRYITELNYVTNENIFGYMCWGKKENAIYLKIEKLEKVNA